MFPLRARSNILGRQTYLNPWVSMNFPTVSYLTELPQRLTVIMPLKRWAGVLVQQWHWVTDSSDGHYCPEAFRLSS